MSLIFWSSVTFLIGYLLGAIMSERESKRYYEGRISHLSELLSRKNKLDSIYPPSGQQNEELEDKVERSVL